MQDEKLRRQITVAAAKLIEQKKETNLHRAKLRAARQLIKGYVRKASMPSDAEIQAELNKQYYVEQTDVRFDNLREQRISAWNFVRRLDPSYPVFLSGTIVDGEVRTATGLTLTFSENDQAEVIEQLARVQFEQLDDDTNDLSVDSAKDLTFELEVEFKEQPEENGLTVAEFREILARDYPDLQDQLHVAVTSLEPDRFEIYRMLLAPLEQVQQPRRTHPEGDALYHSLQVFELARIDYPEDEDFLLAALLHDVGKAIDPRSAETATLNILAEYVSDRTFWLIEHLPEARRLLENDLGIRAKKRLNTHLDYDQLLDLARYDRDGRVSGGAAPTLTEAIDYLKELAFNCDDFENDESFQS